MTKPTVVSVQGSCDADFEAVRKTFQDHIEQGFEIGAAAAAYVDGKKVVDLWAGHRDAGRRQPWAEDTVACMMSTGKAMGCLCVLKLVDDGIIDLDAPLARYWPEFGQAEKDAITVRQVLSHTSGLVFLDGLERGSLSDFAALRAADMAARRATGLPHVHHRDPESGVGISGYGPRHRRFLARGIRRTTRRRLSTLVERGRTGALRRDYLRPRSSIPGPVARHRQSDRPRLEGTARRRGPRGIRQFAKRPHLGRAERRFR